MDAPDPVVGPTMDVFDGMINVLFVRLMVFAAAPLEAANAVESKLILAAPATPEYCRASRRLHAKSMVFVPAEACGEQFV
jgi:hypothetical protein